MMGVPSATNRVAMFSTRHPSLSTARRRIASPLQWFLLIVSFFSVNTATGCCVSLLSSSMLWLLMGHTAIPSAFVVVVNGLVVVPRLERSHYRKGSFTLSPPPPSSSSSSSTSWRRFVSSELEPPRPAKQDEGDDDENEEGGEHDGQPNLASPLLLGSGVGKRTAKLRIRNRSASTTTPTTTSPSAGSSPRPGQQQPQQSGQAQQRHRDEQQQQEELVVADLSRYEAALIDLWEQEALAKKQRGEGEGGGFLVGFDVDWEIEKLRRYFAGLRRQKDGTWVQEKNRAWPLLSNILLQPSSSSSSSLESTERNGAAAVNNNNNNNLQEREEPTPPTTFDVARVVVANVWTSISRRPFIGATPVPTAVIQKYEGSFFSFIKGVLGGDLQTLAGGPLFLLLNKYFSTYGPIFNLSFGPKSFLVISDPVMAKAILKAAPTQYCKGMLAEILEPIMGKGLIPADPQTWKVRRRAIAPGFHKKWLYNMINLFADRANILTENLLQQTRTKKNSNDEAVPVVVDMEERFCSVTLDIIGKAVFNYDFGSVTNESPIVKAVYRVLREAEHRSTSFIPYWNLPYADQWMGGQVEFRKDLTLLNDILANLINQAVRTRQEASIEELEERENSDDPSLLRFLVDMRGEDLSSNVLRDDLMTMLIAGHETTAAMLTWTLFELSRGDPALLHEVQTEVRTVLKDKDRPDYDDLVAMKKLRYCLIESLRLYPEPPVLIRRARTDDTLPPGSSRLSEHAAGIQLLRGTDIFISTWNLHRSPDLWENPNQFDPTRWERPFHNAHNVPGWAGYDPIKGTTMGLYPNELASDFAFLPFGGGQRKCVGDQFAVMEATVTMSIVLKHLDFTLAIPPEQVGMKTGATIHTANGLMMHIQPTKTTTTTTTTPPKMAVEEVAGFNVEATNGHQEDFSAVAAGLRPPVSATTTTTTTAKTTTTTTSTSGWWEMQHLQRGLSASGRPFDQDVSKSKDNLRGVLRSTNATTTTSTASTASCPF